MECPAGVMLVSLDCTFLYELRLSSRVTYLSAHVVLFCVVITRVTVTSEVMLIECDQGVV